MEWSLGIHLTKVPQTFPILSLLPGPLRDVQIRTAKQRNVLPTQQPIVIGLAAEMKGSSQQILARGTKQMLPLVQEHLLLANLSTFYSQFPNNPGQSGVVIKISNDNPPKAFISKGFQRFENGKIPTFMDSGASDTMFVLRNVFTEYKLVVSCVGDSAKGENGNFEIIREGSVTQQYQV